MSLAIGNTVNTAVDHARRAHLSAGLAPAAAISARRAQDPHLFRPVLTSDILLFEASRAAPDAILGKVEGPSAVALFGRASGLVDVFARFMSQAMWSVTLPFFSKVKREGGEVGSALAQAQAYFLGVAWPFYAVLAFSAHPVMLTLFGDQWVASIPVLRWMTAFGAATAATMFASTALIAANHAARRSADDRQGACASHRHNRRDCAFRHRAAGDGTLRRLDRRDRHRDFGDPAHAGHYGTCARPHLCAGGVPHRVERPAGVRARSCRTHGRAAPAGPARACRCVGRSLAVGLVPGPPSAGDRKW